MKRLMILILLILMTSCAPEAAPTSQAVQIPEIVQLAIGALVLAALTAGMVYLFERTGLDLRGYAVPVSVTIAAFVVAQLQGLIDLIPVQYDPVLTVALEIIAVIVSGLGVLRLRANQPARLL